jgi:ABC-2 type transport system ATP-binding protein
LVEGADLAALADELKPLPGVLSVAAFGNALHVAGRDAARLAASIAVYRERGALRWLRSEPNLEDVFINLLSHPQQEAGAAA